jgi:dihydrofolate synthase/folylpolyglutamate synthase
VFRQAQAVSAHWYATGHGYDWSTTEGAWSWHSNSKDYQDLPLPALPGTHQLQNAAGVLMVLEALATRYPLSRKAIEQGLRTASLAGRFQRLPGSVETLLDVAHNPGSARELAQLLRQRGVPGRTRMVLGMLADKDISAFAALLAPVVTDWYLATLRGERGLSANQLQQAIGSSEHPGATWRFQDVATAFTQAHADAKAGDRVVVCGSFVTVAEALACHV